MQEAGINTVEMKENIEKSGMKIAKELNKLLGKEEIVIINNEKYVAGKQNQEIPLLNPKKGDLLNPKKKPIIKKKLKK